MEFNGKAVYFVAVKIFLRRGDELLLLHDIFDTWELPGGRIKLDEWQKPLVETVARKLRKELGDEVKYSTPKPTGTFFQVSRTEKTAEQEQEVRIFAIGFEAEYLGGEIKLSEIHDAKKWVDVRDFKPLELQNNDWMHGVEGYLKSLESKEVE